MHRELYRFGGVTFAVESAEGIEQMCIRDRPYSEWVAGTDNRWFWDGYVENGSKYVFLDFAVVYEDNTQNPSSFPSDNTLFYHFDGCSESNPRILGAISFTENSDYEIWKVTVTDGPSTGYSNLSLIHI